MLINETLYLEIDKESYTVEVIFSIVNMGYDECKDIDIDIHSIESIFEDSTGDEVEIDDIEEHVYDWLERPKNYKTLAGRIIDTD